MLFTNVHRLSICSSSGDMQTSVFTRTAEITVKLEVGVRVRFNTWRVLSQDFKRNRQDETPPLISGQKAKVVYSSIRNQSMEGSLVDPLQKSSAETHEKYIYNIVSSSNHRDDLIL